MMKLEILKIIKNLQVKFVEKQNIWALGGRHLYLSNNNGKNWKKHSVLQMGLKKAICTQSSLVRRLICLDDQVFIKLENDIIVVLRGLKSIV